MRCLELFADLSSFLNRVGVLEWLKKQPNFSCYTNSRVLEVSEKGLSIPLITDNKHVVIKTENASTIDCNNAIMATCVPLQKLSVVAEMEYMRTYCIAIKVAKGTVEDCLLYDSAEAYKYIRLTHCDKEHDYMVVGGCDHKVGQEDTTGRFGELETWTRERFPSAGSVDYAWSGQIFDPVDYMAFIGLDPGTKHTYIVTGDSGNGLTHGVIAGRLLADEIESKPNDWSSIYNPKRMASIVKSAGSMLAHDLQINAQYKRFLQSDIADIEDIANGEGGVMNNSKTGKPTAIYKDDKGKTHKFSALCPHMKGVVCWNRTEKSWDCPVHGSRFSKDGVQLIGPAKGNLQPMDESGKEMQGQTAKV
jgi:Rieske Fe-S protein